jgi:hypothetical protein
MLKHCQGLFYLASILIFEMKCFPVCRIVCSTFIILTDNDQENTILLMKAIPNDPSQAKMFKTNFYVTNRAPIYNEVFHFFELMSRSGAFHHKIEANYVF